MDSYNVRRRILEILTEFETTKIRDRRIYLSEDSIKLMVGDTCVPNQDEQFKNALDWLKCRGFIELQHKCGEPRWKTIRLFDEQPD